MTTKDELFRLIKSLDKNEKQYFKQFSKLRVKGDENGYVELFNAIEAQQEYDEKVLLLRFKGKGFTRNFSQAKYGLTAVILRALRNYHHNNLEVIKVNDQISNIEILIRKKHYQVALSLVTKVWKSSDAKANYYDRLRLLELKRQLTININDQNMITDSARGYKLEQLSILSDLQNDVEVKSCHMEMYALFKNKGYLLKSQDIKFAKQLKAKMDALLQSANCADKHRTLLYQASILYHHLMYEREEALVPAYALVAISEKRKNDSIEQQNTHASNLTNLIIMLTSCQKETAALDEFNKLTAHIAESKWTHIFQQDLCRAYSSLLALFVESGNLEQARKYADESEKVLSATDTFAQPVKVSYYIYQIWLNLYSERYTDALRYITYLVNVVHTNTSVYNFIISRLANLILNFQTGQHRALKSIAKSTIRHAKKADNMDESMQVLLNFFMAYPVKEISVEDKTERFKGLRLKLLNLNEKKGNLVFTIPEVYYWIESHARNITMANALGKKEFAKAWASK